MTPSELDEILIKHAKRQRAERQRQEEEDHRGFFITLCILSIGVLILLAL